MLKRELRKYANPGLNFSPGHGLLHTEAIGYIARAAVKIIAGQRVLVLWLYDRKAAAQGDNRPCYTVFQARRDYTTLARKTDGTLQWHAASLPNLLGAWPRKEVAFYTQADLQRVTRFCAVPEKEGLEALEQLQTDIMAACLRVRVLARERNIIETMRRVPTTPRDLTGWIRREVLPPYVFYKRHGKNIAGWCSACRHEVQLDNAHHNAAGHCPRCGRAITFKSAGMVGKLCDRETAQVIQRTGEKELLIRIFKAQIKYRDYRTAKAEIWESARLFVRWDGDEELAVEPYYNAYSGGIATHWRAGVRPSMNHWVITFEQDVCGRIHPRSFDALTGTPWQYSQLRAFYEYNREPMEVLPYLRRYEQYPLLEYLVKLRLYALAREFVYSSYCRDVLHTDGRNPREILGVGPENFPLLQAIDATPAQLKLLRTMRQQGIRPDEALLRWYAAHDVLSADDVLHPLRYMSPHKLMQYVDGQFARLRDTKTPYGARRYTELRNVLGEYNDYLRQGAALRYDLANSFVLFPRDLRTAHDLATKRFDAKKDKIVAKAIGAAHRALTDAYGYSRDGFAILAPKSAQEIIAEGHALHHCVGCYAERVAKNECIILFLRRTDNLRKPFVTLRVRNGTLDESRGACNGQPPPEAKAFLGRWEREVLRRTEQQRIAA